MKTAIKNKIAYGVIWGLLAHVPLLSNAQTNVSVYQPPIIVMDHMASPEPIILGREVSLDQGALSLRQQALSLRQEAMSLRQEALNFRQEPLTPEKQQVLGLKLDTLSVNLEALSLRQESLSYVMSIGGTNDTSGGMGGSPGSCSNSCCVSCCGFINLYNGGAGFTVIAGKTFTIKLSLNSSMTPLINAADYCARWRYGGQPNQTGCFSVIPSTEQQFTAPATAQYFITIYIKTNCPPSGTLYYMSYVTPPPT